MTSPNITYMITKYGKQSTEQLDMWVKECGFPGRGSFSLRQLETLERKLTEEEKKKRKGKPFRADWAADTDWLR